MIFRRFRILVSLIVLAFAAWLVWNSVGQVLDASGGGDSSAYVMPAMKIIMGLLVVGVFYYALVAESRVHTVLENIFSIPELLKKIGFTLGLLCIYRIGFHIPVPGINPEAIKEYMGAQEQGPFGQALAYFSMFTGGSLQQSTLFGLGIMPYISASIIFQLLTTVWPRLEKLQKEGPAGQKKIQEYTRYATVGLCLIQATVWMKFMMATREGGESLVFDEYLGSYRVFLMGVIGMTAGTVFLMWLGEQIDEFGIGNGISLLIMAGIVCRMPQAVIMLYQQADLSLTGISGDKIGLVKIIFLVMAFVSVVAGAILITQGQRRIPIQQAKHTRGRRVYGGQRQYLPLRVNHGGVMPIIFASALMIFPGVVIKYVQGTGWGRQSEIIRVLNDAFQMKSVTYSFCYIGLIFFFAYFWTTIQFRPKEMADQLRDYGSFIPGLRPGRRTAEYLERVMERITYCGAGFLALIAVIPQALAAALEIPMQISTFLGGTGLLITVSVTLDLVQRIEANLVMRNYGGFLGSGQRIKGANR